MLIDLAGHVRNSSLASKNALLPLFEAVVNAAQAIDERRMRLPEDFDGKVTVSIYRDETTQGLLALSATGEPAKPDIVGFEIADNGAGFHETNFGSFNTVSSLLKAKIGGKGVGRLSWLKAFDHATVDSVYLEGEYWFRRTFRFMRTADGVEGMVLERLASPPPEPRTIVRLHGYVDPYRREAAARAETIARRIVEHCLVSFVNNKMPRVILVDGADGGARIDLGNVFKTQVDVHPSPRWFRAGDHSFSIRDVLLRATAETPNAIHFCANGRSVRAIDLGKDNAIAHADGALRGKSPDQDVRYVACVTGDYLDATVNQQREDFNIDQQGTIALHGSPVNWDDIQRAAIESAAEFLTPLLADAREKALARVRKYIEDNEPRYRVLLHHRQADLERIPGSISDSRLQSELNRILVEWRNEAKESAERRLTSASVPDTAEGFVQFKAAAVQALGELQEVVKSDLAEYVLHRRTVIDFFGKVLGLLESGKFAKEDVLHGLFFPMRTSSDEVDYEDHNLWLIDERLAFHHYLASDIKLKGRAKAPFKVDSARRPDLLIFNERMAFSAEDGSPYTSVVLVEFKRPERDTAESEDNPVRQVIEYVRLLRAGAAKRNDGSLISAVSPPVPFFCYVIGTITPELKRQLREEYGFMVGPDGDSCFRYNEPLNTWIEVLDYRKVRADAIKRNNSFFAKLGLPTGDRPIQV